MAGQQLYLNQRSHAASDPIRNFRFLVRFTPLDASFPVNFSPTLGFMSVSGLAMTTEAIPYREGGMNTTVHYLPGQQTFSPVSLIRGVVPGSKQNWHWFQQLFDVGYTVNRNEDTGTPTGHFRCVVSISVLAHPTPLINDYESITSSNDWIVQKFYLLNAWPTNIAYSDLNAADNAVLVEQMTLVHEGLSVEWTKNNFDPINPAWDKIASGRA